MKAPAAAAAGHNNPPPLGDQLREKYASLWDRFKKWERRAKIAKDIKPQTLEDCTKLKALFREGADLENDIESARKKEKDEYLRLGQTVDTTFKAGLSDQIGATTQKPGLARDLLQAAADFELAEAEKAQAAAKAAADKARATADALAEKAAQQDAAGKGKLAQVTENRADAAIQEAEHLETVAAAPVQNLTRSTVGGLSSSVKAKLVCEGVVRGELDLEALRPYLKQEHLVEAVNKALGLEAFTTLKGASIVKKAVGSVRR